MPIRTAALSALALSLPTLALQTLALPTLAMAEEARHAEAHVHGVSRLQVAVEGAAVEAELRAPGADIVGFEHAARSDADIAAVEAALTALRDPAALFGLAGCAVQQVEAHVDREGDEHHDGHDDGHDDHADEHDEDGHAEHEHEHEHEHDEDAHADHEDHADDEPGHAEFHAVYALTCDAPATALDLSGFFAAFPRAAEVEIETITDHGVHADEATRAAAAVPLR
ncbi:ZrgA family zinc uptake protein [Rhodovulum sp. DZ06]|uniref:ZrgA family zinc uptake protein n=1 Tax=Rhodovulum sp. DZ06 TaxID=3425126 RepID=UPI003D33814C